MKENLITNEQIYQEVQEHLQIDLECVFRLLAQAKHGEKSDLAKLTGIEQLLFCLEFGRYSYLERGFIRSFSRKPNNEEKAIYVKLCNTTIDIKNQKSLKQRKTELDDKPNKTQEYIWEYQVISALLSAIGDRSSISKTINPWLKIALKVETLPDQWMLVEMLRQSCKKK